MSATSQKARKLIDIYSDGRPFEEVLEMIKPRDPRLLSAPPDLPGTLSWHEGAKEKRLAFLEEHSQTSLAHLSGKAVMPEADYYKGNIENFIGCTQVPTGLVGPLLINGTVAQGDYYLPLATTEGALVASAEPPGGLLRAPGAHPQSAL